eukprot:GFUD01043246.1.p1 GENE.GFUD01043246.1~~GFUD01043246.1.p1  ORF type:complete len:280 (+),score=76.70 GFUD01043246.1:88-927(+)
MEKNEVNKRDLKMKENKRQSDRKENSCKEVCKYLFGFYNMVFLLCGCLICGLGVWTITEKWCFLYLMEVKTYQVTAWLLVSTGVLSVLTAVLGYTAVGCESRCLLGTYTVLIVLVFMVESVIGLMSYVYQEQIGRDLSDKLVDTFILRYDTDKHVMQAVDRVQQQFQCCGVNSFSDWSASPWKTDHPGLRVPDSCCKTQSLGCGERDHPSNIPYTGCIHRFKVELSQELYLVSLCSLGVGLLQVMGVIITTCLFSSMKENNREKKGSRMAMKQGVWRSV